MGSIENKEKNIIMSVPTFLALISLLAAGLVTYGMTQSDLSTVKRDIISQSAQIDRLNNKIDNLTSLLYEDRQKLRDERRGK